jgi:hypothetical protein
MGPALVIPIVEAGGAAVAAIGEVIGIGGAAAAAEGAGAAAVASEAAGVSAGLAAEATGSALAAGEAGGLITAEAGTAGSESLTLGVARNALVRGARVVKGAVETSAKTIVRAVPKTSLTTKVVSGSLAVGGGYHFLSHVGHGDSPGQALDKTEDDLVDDAKQALTLAGTAVGKGFKAAIGGASEGLFGDSNLLWELGLLAGGLWFMTR